MKSTLCWRIRQAKECNENGRKMYVKTNHLEKNGGFFSNLREIFSSYFRPIFATIENVFREFTRKIPRKVSAEFRLLPSRSRTEDFNLISTCPCCDAARRAKKVYDEIQKFQTPRSS